MARTWLGVNCSYSLREHEPGTWMLWTGQGFKLVPVAKWKQWTCAATAAIDVGGNVGDTAVPMAKSLGAQGVVLALELVTAFHINLAVQAAINRPLRILPFNIGVSGQECAGKASCGMRHPNSLRRLVHLPTWIGGAPLSQVLPHLSFIKIDVDELSPTILASLLDMPSQGAAKSDPRYRPVIKVEWFHRHRAERCRSAASRSAWVTAEALNYTVYGADGATHFPSCSAAVTQARHRGDLNGGGDTLYADLVLFPNGVSKTTRHRFCPAELPQQVLAQLPTLPIPPYGQSQWSARRREVD